MALLSKNGGTEETMEHVYREFKVFKLKFSWTSSDGSKVLEKNYDVLRAE